MDNLIKVTFKVVNKELTILHKESLSGDDSFIKNEDAFLAQELREALWWGDNCSECGEDYPAFILSPYVQPMGGFIDGTYTLKILYEYEENGDIFF